MSEPRGFPPSPIALITRAQLYRDLLSPVLVRLGHDVVVLPDASPAGAALRVETAHAGVALVDMAMPESAAVLAALAALAVPPGIIAFGLTDSDESLMACADAGVSGYLGTDVGTDGLAAAIECVTQGETYCSSRLAAWLVRWLAARRGLRGDDRLTDRECEIAGLIDRGLTNKEIARSLHIELTTVKNHVHSILAKLQVRRRRDVGMRVNGRNATHRTPVGAAGPDRRI